MTEGGFQKRLDPRLLKLSRWTCAIVGTILLAAATVAVLLGSGVGVIGLAGAGLLLFLIGVAGQLPSKLKLGDNEIWWQLRDELERARTDDVQTVVEAAAQVSAEIAEASQDRSDSSSEPVVHSTSEVQGRIVQELESTAPAIAERLTEVRQFEKSVGEILQLLAREHGWTVHPDVKVGFTTVDFVVRSGQRSVGVEARLTRPSMDESLGYGLVSMFAGSSLQGVVFRTPTTSFAP